MHNFTLHVHNLDACNVIQSNFNNIIIIPILISHLLTRVLFEPSTLCT